MQLLKLPSLDDTAAEQLFEGLVQLEDPVRRLVDSITKEWILRHMHFDNALRELAGYIDDDVPGQLLSLTGESRTGKTVLLKAINLHQNWLAEKQGRRIGAVYIELSVPRNGQFDADDLYHKILEEAGAALIHQKIPYPPLELGAPSRKELAAKGKGRGLEFAFLQYAKEERFVILIDDVNTLVRTLGPCALSRLAETIKHVVNASGFTFVVAGCPELAVLTSQTDQLVARKEHVELLAYRATQLELQALCDALDALEKKLAGWCRPGTLYESTEDVQRLSYGRWGLVTKWTARVIAQVSREGGRVFDWARWERVASAGQKELSSSAHISFSGGIHTPDEESGGKRVGGDATWENNAHNDLFKRKPKNKPLHSHGK